MLDQKQLGKSKSNTTGIKKQEVSFKLKLNQEEDIYIILKKKDQQFNPDDNKYQMKLDEYNNQSYYYKATINVELDQKYEYQYCKKNNDKFINENCFRGFQYSARDPMEEDEWNKQWCKYIFNFSNQNPLIFKGYQTVIRDNDPSNHNEIELEDIPGYCKGCKESIDLDQKPKNRQLCFNQLNLDGQQSIAGEYLEIINVTKVDKFSSNLILVEFKGLDQKARERMKSYSTLFVEVKKLKQQLKELIQTEGFKRNGQVEQIIDDKKNNQEIMTLQLEFKYQMEIQTLINNQQEFEQQKMMMEKEFDDFKNYSEKIIKKYIEQIEIANHKIMELEFSKVNFQSEEMKIQAEDYNQLSKEEQKNLKELQDQLIIYESKMKEIKEENQSVQEKLQKKDNNLKQRCQKTIVELKKCQEQLEKCEKNTQIVQKERQLEKNIIEEKSSRYQLQLKEFYGILKKQEQQLVNYINLEQKYQEEQKKNQEQKKEFDDYEYAQRQKQNEQINQLKDQNKFIIQNQKRNLEIIGLYQQKIDIANEQEIRYLNKLINCKAELKFGNIRKEMNSKIEQKILQIKSIFATQNSRQKSFQDTKQQFGEIIQEIPKLLKLFSVDKIKNLKDLGIQITEELKQLIEDKNLENLLNENFLMQVCKLIVILNEISQDEEIKDQNSKDIEPLSQLNNQLESNVKIIRRIQYNLSDQTKEKCQSIIILMFIYLVMIYMPRYELIDL